VAFGPSRQSSADLTTIESRPSNHQRKGDP